MKYLSFGLAALFAAAPLTSADARCPTADDSPLVYGIGGSTMGTLLGPMLDRVFETENGITFKRWGKASSGLARPDFHDWPKETPRLMKKHDPEVVVISLGTNDYQALWDDGRWIRQDDTKWETKYAERVDAMLEAMSADDEDRLIIWSGPYAFNGKNAVKRAPVVNRIMKERVEAFAAKGGNAVFLDAYAMTSDDDGTPLKEKVLPNGDKAEKIRTKDGIHLTADAVRQLLAQPIVAMALPCFAESEAKEPGTKAANP